MGQLGLEPLYASKYDGLPRNPYRLKGNLAGKEMDYVLSELKRLKINAKDI